MGWHTKVYWATVVIMPYFWASGRLIAEILRTLFKRRSGFLKVPNFNGRFLKVRNFYKPVGYC